MFGRFAADSSREGATARGILRSQPFVVDAAHLRFVWAGPANAQLRVYLRSGEAIVRSASPSGTTQDVEWNTEDLVGTTVELVLEDNSTVAGFAADGFVVY
jgi:hypothetical protein